MYNYIQCNHIARLIVSKRVSSSTQCGLHRGRLRDLKENFSQAHPSWVIQKMLLHFRRQMLAACQDILRERKRRRGTESRTRLKAEHNKS